MIEHVSMHPVRVWAKILFPRNNDVAFEGLKDFPCSVSASVIQNKNFGCSCCSTFQHRFDDISFVFYQHDRENVHCLIVSYPTIALFGAIGISVLPRLRR